MVDTVSLIFRERLREPQHGSVGAGDRDVVELLVSTPSCRAADRAGQRRRDLGSDVGARRLRRCSEHGAVGPVHRDLGVDDPRDAGRDAVRMALAVLDPEVRALALLLESLIELPHEVPREHAVEHEERDHSRNEDDRYVAREQLRAERERHDGSRRR